MASCRRDTASDVRWVGWLYRAFLGRDTNLAGAASWLTFVRDGVPYVDIARAIGTSNEASRRRATLTGVRLLRRSPGAGELADWSVFEKANGANGLAARLLGSDEYFSMAGGTTDAWIDQAYQDVLGRAVDNAGRTYWGARISQGADRTRVALELSNSPAAVRRRVDAVYRAILGRPGDSGGISYWAPLALAGGDIAIESAMAASQAGWSLGQITYGAPATAMPAACPKALRWVPPAGSIVRDLNPLAAQGTKLVALTFDDGPDARWTPQILDTLKQYRVPATFFLVGFKVRKNPDLVRRELAEGHRVAVHTMTHPDLKRLGYAAQRREIVDDVNLVELISGKGSVRCFRPPYGNHDANTDRIAREEGLATILWSRDGRDWDRPGVSYIVNQNLDTRYDGGRGVLLLHDSGTDRSQTVAALPKLIEALHARGYKFVQIC